MIEADTALEPDREHQVEADELHDRLRDGEVRLEQDRTQPKKEKEDAGVQNGGETVHGK